MAIENVGLPEVQSREGDIQSIAAIMVTLSHVIEAEVGVGAAEISSAFNPEDPDCKRSRQEILGWLALLDADDSGAAALKSGAFDSLKLVPEDDKTKRPALKLVYIAPSAPEPTPAPTPPPAPKPQPKPVSLKPPSVVSERSARFGSQKVIFADPWRDEAACLDEDPDMFFPPEGDSQRAEAAIRVCLRCEVKQDCLNFALNNNESEGIWGGMTPRERLKLLKVNAKAAKGEQVADMEENIEHIDEDGDNDNHD